MSSLLHDAGRSKAERVVSDPIYRDFCCHGDDATGKLLVEVVRRHLAGELTTGLDGFDKGYVTDTREALAAAAGITLDQYDHRAAPRLKRLGFIVARTWKGEDGKRRVWWRLLPGRLPDMPRRIDRKALRRSAPWRTPRPVIAAAPIPQAPRPKVPAPKKPEIDRAVLHDLTARLKAERREYQGWGHRSTYPTKRRALWGLSWLCWYEQCEGKWETAAARLVEIACEMRPETAAKHLSCGDLWVIAFDTYYGIDLPLENATVIPEERRWRPKKGWPPFARLLADQRRALEEAGYKSPCETAQNL